MKLKTLIVVFLAAFVSGCGLFGGKGSSDVSRTTGWAYNSDETGNIPYESGYEQETGPGLVFIQGGTFTMGRVEQDVMYKWDNYPRRVTVASFYMDEAEVSNQDYREYTHWLSRVYPGDREKIQAALPDTMVWRSELAYNEPYVNNYFRHPAYSDYPVVGVTWEQAEAYCAWRTDRVNEQILVDKGIIQHDNTQSGQNVFTTDTYLAGLYQGTDGEEPIENADGTTRRLKWEDGIALPSYRLPTEAEWEYAALGLVGNTMQERIVERRVYPWNGDGLRTDDSKFYGSFVANFKRGRGDYMGVAGSLNDGADLPAPVGSYWPNDYGLYNMGGNVSEWVLDVYRPLSFEDVADYNPFRGNIFMNKKRDADGFLAEKDSLGRMVYVEVSPEEAANRKNYRRGYNVNYGDGDFMSSIQDDWSTPPENQKEMTDQMYEYGVTSLVSDKARVYKGGSWADGPYYLSPGTRRFLNEDESASSIGFRCAMNKVGSSLVNR